MSEQWMGLHNHDRHFYSPGYGDRCGKCWYCSPETPCYCCLQAEVEALRAQVQRVRQLARLDEGMTDMALNIEYEDWIREKRADIAQHNLSIQANIAALSQRLWAAEQTLEQVRLACDKWAAVEYGPPLAMVNDLRRILGGGDGDA
jgi:hypothetical protein